MWKLCLYSMIMWFMIGKKSSWHLHGQSFSCLISQITTHIGEVEAMEGPCFLPNTEAFILCPSPWACWALLIVSVCKAVLKRSKPFTIRARFFSHWENTVFNLSAILLDTNEKDQNKPKQNTSLFSLVDSQDENQASSQFVSSLGVPSNPVRMN